MSRCVIVVVVVIVVSLPPPPPLPPPPLSEANRLQSSLLDTWNATFGALPLTSRDREAAFFPPALLRLLSRMAGRAEVKMPPGMAFGRAEPAGPAGHGAREDAASRDLHEDGEEDGEDEDEDEQSLPTSFGGSRVAGMLPTSFGGNHVAGVLPAPGARRSFMPQGRR